jgi:hypothetical protein
MTCLIVEKAQILIFHFSFNTLCASILIYSIFCRQKKVITFFHPNHLKYYS